MKRFMPLARRAAFVILAAWLLYLVSREADPGRLLRVFGEAAPPLILAAVLLDFCVHLCKALKWGVVLSPVRRARLSSLFSAVTIGVMSNNLLFLRLDELVRIFVLGHRENLTRSTVLGSIVVERSIDLFFLLGCLTLALRMAPPDLPEWFGVAGLGAGLLLVAAALVMTASVKWTDRLAEAAGRLPGSLGQKAPRMFRDYVDGLRTFPSGARLLKSLLLAAAEWGFTAALFAAIAASLGMSLAPSLVLLLVVAAYASFAVPSTPGAVGLYEAVLIHGLTVAGGAELEVAIGFTLLTHAVLLLPVSIVGMAFLWREEMSIFSLKDLAGRKDGSSS